MNRTGHGHSLLIFSWTVLMCIVKELEHAKSFSRKLHCRRIRFSCTVLTFVFSVPTFTNADSHWPHWKSRLFICTDTTCVCRLLVWPKAALQSMHLYFFLFSWTTLTWELKELGCPLLRGACHFKLLPPLILLILAWFSFLWAHSKALS